MSFTWSRLQTLEKTPILAMTSFGCCDCCCGHGRYCRDESRVRVMSSS